VTSKFFFCFANSTQPNTTRLGVVHSCILYQSTQGQKTVLRASQSTQGHMVSSSSSGPSGLSTRASGAEHSSRTLTVVFFSRILKAPLPPSPRSTTSLCPSSITFSLAVAAAMEPAQDAVTSKSLTDRAGAAEKKGQQGTGYYSDADLHSPEPSPALHAPPLNGVAIAEPNAVTAMSDPRPSPSPSPSPADSCCRAACRCRRSRVCLSFFQRTPASPSTSIDRFAPSLGACSDYPYLTFGFFN